MTVYLHALHLPPYFPPGGLHAPKKNNRFVSSLWRTPTCNNMISLRPLRPPQSPKKMRLGVKSQIDKREMLQYMMLLYVKV